MSGLTLPLSIFVAEVCVVTLSTLRILFIARGRKLLAPVIGFFEVGRGLFAIGQVMKNLSNPGCYLGFAAGFTLGNFLGIVLEGRLALGTLVVRVITPRDVAPLVAALRRRLFPRWPRPATATARAYLPPGPLGLRGS